MFISFAAKYYIFIMKKPELELLNKSKEQLVVLARDIGITGISKMTKQELVDVLLNKVKRSELKKAMGYSWFQRTHAHIYGIVGIVGLLFSTFTIMDFFDYFGTITTDTSLIPIADYTIYNKEEINDEERLDNEDSEKYEYDDWSFHYEIEEKNGEYYVSPTHYYLNNFYQDEWINMEYLPWSDWQIEPYPHNPEFDIKIVNNTKKTLFVDKLYVDVEESKRDTRPLIFLYFNENLTSGFYMLDQSWESWDYFDFQFSILKKNEEFDGNYKYSQRIEAFEGVKYFDIKPYLIEEGVNYKELEKIAIEKIEKNEYYDKSTSDQKLNIQEHIEKLLSSSFFDKEVYDMIKPYMPFLVEPWQEVAKGDYSDISSRFPRAYIYGEVKFNNYEPSIFVTGELLLYLIGGGADLQPSMAFDVELKLEGRDYTIEYPTSLVIKSKEAERIQIRLTAPQSSYHKFRFRLNSIEGTIISTKMINLELFRQKHIFGDLFGDMEEITDDTLPSNTAIPVHIFNNDSN